jgi:hypothetical protein
VCTSISGDNRALSWDSRYTQSPSLSELNRADFPCATL